MDPAIEIRFTENDAKAELLKDVTEGLTAQRKQLPPKWRWDSEGSAIFERITRTPEYYPFRIERELLRTSAQDIAKHAKVETLVELGSGSSEKTRLLLDAYAEIGSPVRTFVPFDVSYSALHEATVQLARDYPELAIHGVVADFSQDLAPVSVGDGPRLVAFLGGTIGNLPPAERAGFLTTLHEVLAPGDLLLIGAGQVTDPEVILAAYDDPAGVATEFNRNVLHMLNRSVAADFDPMSFDHVVRWNDTENRMEGFLRATKPMTVKLAGLDLEVHFSADEHFRTDISAKFHKDDFSRELADAGFEPRKWWTDSEDLFMLGLSSR
ncbi:L-histidine N(alpha)-methyltransferase [Amycolatopsis samaneae]|uniref:L-histidine N(Alpha)-methyltransferase n=1 Tax=Amycolatopsis samaneae TaxID=664691 RepID=A0ABW5GK86_9PSEU